MYNHKWYKLNRSQLLFHSTHKNSQVSQVNRNIHNREHNFSNYVQLCFHDGVDMPLHSVGTLNFIFSIHFLISERSIGEN